MSYRPRKSTHAPETAPDAAILRDERKLIETINRRGLIRGGVSLGALTLLTGCDVTDQSSVNGALRTVSTWNDRAQAALFNPNKLAPVYSKSEVIRPPRFNAYYNLEDIKPVDPVAWRLDFAGGVANKTAWTLADVMALPQIETIIRHVCVEGWSYVGDWSGPTLRSVLEKVGADLTKPFVGFHCADDYVTSMDMPTALHPQTILATHYDGKPITDPYGSPVRVRTSTKLGFKNPKWVTAIEITDKNPGGYWEDRGYNWFSGL
ncbi:MAG: molybdopterin-dependent oxidoreductase [Beijerinckiaceae bacterium]|jgi:DMSO/TMAO reductase YedYZ molybdopterin-dependent catalytic subunit